MNIIDIAAQAGVSTATVSRVINNGKVSEALRAKVEAVIRQHQYLPNHLARGLITGTTMNVGVVTHSLSNSYAWEFVEAVGLRLKEHGYRQFVSSSNGGPDDEAQYIASFLSQKVDGLVLHDPSLDNYRSGFFRETARRVPLVMVHSSVDEVTDVNSVIVDQVLGMNKVMRHLLELGHRSIWFVRSSGYSQDLKERVWRDRLAEAGSSPSDADVVFIPDGDVEGAIREAEEALTTQLRTRTPPTAIFASNDLMATGCLLALRREGLNIPADVSLVGHDNTFLAAVGGFTSVDMKRPSVGHATVDLLLSAISGRDQEARRVLISPDLVDRGSTSPPRRE